MMPLATYCKMKANGGKQLEIDDRNLHLNIVNYALGKHINANSPSLWPLFMEQLAGKMGTEVRLAANSGPS